MGNDKTDLSLEDIKLPFIILGIAFIVVAFYEFSKIENQKTVITESSDTFRVLDYPQLYLGMLAIFIYRGNHY
jgi:FHS family L-fucose permease-like MFS transporter